MANRIEWLKWLASFCAGIAFSAVSYFLLFHVAFGMEFWQVAKLFGEIASLAVIFVPLLWYLRQRWAKGDGTLTAFFWVAAVCMASVSWIFFNHAVRAGLLNEARAERLLWIVLGMAVVVILISPYLHAKIFSRK